MDDLLTRLEQATEGSRELDVEIYLNTFPAFLVSKEPDGYIYINYTGTALTPIWEDFHSHHAPRYTTSIDAALTQLPEGFGYAVETRPHSNQDKSDVPAIAWVSRLRDEPSIPSIAATPALALCIAIRKAVQD